MKGNVKKLSFLLFGLVLLLAACGSGGSSSTDSKGNESNNASESGNADDKTYKIGITQIVEHPSLNAATEGFKKAIEDAGLKVEYDPQIAQGDNSLNTTIANNLVSANVDLIFANSTPSAQAAATATSDIPIIFTSVTDAVGAQLIESMEKPGKNVTGTIDLHPETISKTVAFLKELGAKNVGMVYNAGEQNSVAQVSEVKKVMGEQGLTVVEASASTSADVKQATESLIGKVDAFYIITDNTVVSALESVIDVANTNKLPLIVGELDSVARGGLAAYGFEYFDIGYEAGQMAVKILKGEATPADTPAQYPQNLKLLINKKVADDLEIEIKDSWGAELLEK
ncbi:ABC transporter substrate-binding protein [Lysinibacillus irui]|uniref:ABC transporter substrate-binding protein n=1 Tax=Lysinibacillus irui TaxID=2998077 RepID=A0ABU5NGI4_9BACI|nr:ABC transporter substrate-binding protein [Lysinibacillus irui]MEA0553906.1 ABC transporter substrate-binding protein [Lysinibacillus irui]MEA0975152.1 ABC transporter substrate-binding protein [Lysinibacillus irui]MEA1041306.1 ABC transporter substrate-binding protein [Lysinibacillus irui]